MHITMLLHPSFDIKKAKQHEKASISYFLLICL